MFLFMAPPGHGEAICPGDAGVGPGHWRLLGPLAFTNPAALSGGGTHKPYVVMAAQRPNRAARVDGRYWLLVVSNRAGHKLVQRAWASDGRLALIYNSGPYGREQLYLKVSVDAVAGL